MATKSKRNSMTSHQQPDALIVDKNSFREKLLDNVQIGKELYNRPVTNMTELNDNKSNYEKWNDYLSEYLKQSFNNEQNQYKVGYDNVNSYSNMFGWEDTPDEQLKSVKDNINAKVAFIEKLIDKIELLKSEVAIQVTNPAAPKINNTKIFIVHGHNTSVQQSVARTLEKLHLSPIILNEQANEGKTILEKFEKHADVGFAIILLTDDDDGKSKTEFDLKSRARQNVILELGYFMGILGRNKVLPLYIDGVELPSDLHGLLYVKIDNSDAWKFTLVKELRASGYSVDANSIL